MNTQLLQESFARMGARKKVNRRVKRARHRLRRKSKASVRQGEWFSPSANFKLQER